MKLMRDEEGVSPVIGVILMVAITVILAAVIAVFVFGLAGDLESSGQKDLTIKTGTNEAGDITYTVFAGADADSVEYLMWTNGTTASENSASGPLTIGSINTTGVPKAGAELTITAVFNDGTHQVVATVK